MSEGKLVQGSYTRTYGAASDGTHARFFMQPVEDPVATAREGRPIFVEHEYVEMIFPGNPLNKPVQLVNDSHRQRWPKLYEGFKAGQEIALEGTPLEQWPLLKSSQVLEFKALGFRTVEDVAMMNDLAIQRIGMGGRMYKLHAEAFLDDAKQQALSTQLAALNERQTAEIASLTHQVEQLSRLVAQQHNATMQRLDAQDPIATTIPSLADPIERAKQDQTIGSAQSSLAVDLPPVRQRKQKQDAAA